MGNHATAESPYGTEALMVNKLLGPAYLTVKLVADNMDMLRGLSEDTPDLINLTETFVTTVTTINAAAVSTAADAAAAELAAANAQASAIGIADFVTTAGNSAAAAAISEAAAELAEDNAELFAAQAAASALVNGGGIAGNVAVTGWVSLAYEAYGPTWNGSMQAPTKDAIYDQFQTLTDREGVALGFSMLDATGKILASTLPDSIAGALKFQSTWNANTNTPAIPAAAIGNKGFYYVVSVAGSTVLNGVNEWAIGDWLVSDGVTWSKIDNSDKVSSVAGKFGAVVLVKADVGLDAVDNTADADKPVSTPQAAALATKAPLNPREQAALNNSITPSFTDDIITRTLTGAATINNLSGAAVDGHGIVIRLKDNGTPYGITWDTQYRVIGDIQLPVLTSSGKTYYVGGIWNADAAKLDVLYVGQEV